MSEQKIKIAIWASSAYSEWDISDTLRGLCVTHTVDPRDQTKACKLVNMRMDQPKEVHITTCLKTVRPQAVNFIVASYGELAATNIPILPFVNSNTLEESLKTALLSDTQVVMKVQKFSSVDYINYVAKPSLLNKIQTELLRIQPYSLRVEARDAVLAYFNSRMSKRTVVSFLNKNLRLERLKDAILLGDDLKAAVALLVELSDVEVVATRTGVPAFDIMYLTNAGKLKAKPSNVRTK